MPKRRWVRERRARGAGVVAERIAVYSAVGGRVAAEDDIETRMMTRATWLPPVASEEELPKVDVVEGSMCYVEGDVSGDEEVWQYRDGRWSRID